MARGVSLHIGLNNVDPAKYGGWDGQLNACEADADDMKAIAGMCGFSTTQLLTAKATSRSVLAALRRSVAGLAAGDILLVTYSGHGGQIPDTGGDEVDGQDETWVLFDRQVLDDELYLEFAAAPAGARIVVLSDSCHSGTITRAAPPNLAGLSSGAAVIANPIPAGGRTRAMPAALAQRDYLARSSVYEKIQQKTRSVERSELAACVLSISGCQDNQESLDGTHNGLFTGTLLTVWNGGGFLGGYRTFARRISRLMPATQSPKFMVLGGSDPAFVKQKPFTV